MHTTFLVFLFFFKPRHFRPIQKSSDICRVAVSSPAKRPKLEPGDTHNDVSNMFFIIHILWLDNTFFIIHFAWLELYYFSV
jgi:hypothetical protein